jgi:hypothetical protein
MENRNRTRNRGRGRGRRGQNKRGRGKGRRGESRMYEQLNNTSTPNNLRNNYPFPQSKVYKIVMCETYVEQGASPFVIRQFALNDITLPDPASVNITTNRIKFNINNIRVISCTKS